MNEQDLAQLSVKLVRTQETFTTDVSDIYDQLDKMALEHKKDDILYRFCKLRRRRPKKER